MNNLDNIWIALAHVKPRVGFEDALNGRPGAYLNIIGKAKDEEKLKILARKTFFNEGFELKENLRDIELLSDRLKQFNVDKDILDLVNDINDTYPIQFAKFHTYPEEDEIKDDVQIAKH